MPLPQFKSPAPTVQFSSPSRVPCGMFQPGLKPTFHTLINLSEAAKSEAPSSIFSLCMWRLFPGLPYPAMMKPELLAGCKTPVPTPSTPPPSFFSIFVHASSICTLLTLLAQREIKMSCSEAGQSQITFHPDFCSRQRNLCTCFFSRTLQENNKKITGTKLAVFEKNSRSSSID